MPRTPEQREELVDNIMDLFEQHTGVLRTMRAVGGPHESALVELHRKRVKAAAEAIVDSLPLNAV